MARTTRKERMERRQVALQKVSNGMGISEVVDFVSTEWGAHVELLDVTAIGFWKSCSWDWIRMILRI